MRFAVAYISAALVGIVIACFCALHGEQLFGLFAGIGTGCALLKLAEKVGWA